MLQFGHGMHAYCLADSISTNLPLGARALDDGEDETSSESNADESKFIEPAVKLGKIIFDSRLNTLG